MISYNDQDKAWTQRVHKELWTKDELKTFTADVATNRIRQKFALNEPEMQQEHEMTTKEKFDRIKQAQRIKAIKTGAFDDISSTKDSAWSCIPADPKAVNDRLIWTSKLHAKNEVTRNQNKVIGRLGQYIVGDPDQKLRLDSKLKSITARKRQPASSLDINQLL